MADDPGTKTIVDMALGAATTVSFAFGPVGVGIAAAIAVGKFLFDLFYQTSGLTDPMQQAPDKADLQNGLDKLRAQLGDDLFNEFKTQFQVDLFAASDKLNDAIRNAGAAPKAGLCMPGATVVWVNGQTDTLWQPLTNNPDIFSRTIGWVTLHPSRKFATAPLHALAVSLNLLYLKTALVWEVNENLRDFEKRHVAWKSAMAAYTTALATWQAIPNNPAPKPVKPATPEPQPPTGGDIALGSEVRDAQGLIVDAGSHLGKVSSKWAIATRDLLNDKDSSGKAIGPIAWLDAVLVAWDLAMVKKNKAITDRLARMTTIPIPLLPTGTLINVWMDQDTGATGSPIDHAGFQWLQAEIWKEGVAGNMDHDLIHAADLDKLTADDIAKLRQTLGCWRATLRMYQDAIKTLDDGPINPSNT